MIDEIKNKRLSLGFFNEISDIMSHKHGVQMRSPEKTHCDEYGIFNKLKFDRIRNEVQFNHKCRKNRPPCKYRNYVGIFTRRRNFKLKDLMIWISDVFTRRDK